MLGNSTFVNDCERIPHVSEVCNTSRYFLGWLTQSLSENPFSILQHSLIIESPRSPKYNPNNIIYAPWKFFSDLNHSVMNESELIKKVFLLREYSRLGVQTIYPIIALFALWGNNDRRNGNTTWCTWFTMYWNTTKCETLL